MKTIILLVPILLSACSFSQLEVEPDPFKQEPAEPIKKTDLNEAADYAKNNHGIVSVHRHGPGYDVMMMLNAGESDIIFSMDLPPGGDTFIPEITEAMKAQNPEQKNAEGATGDKSEEEFFNKQSLALFSEATQHILSAQALFYRKSYWKALEETNKAISLVPASAQAYALKGSIYYKMGRKKEAKVSWQKALEYDPSLTDVKESLKLVN